MMEQFRLRMNAAVKKLPWKLIYYHDGSFRLWTVPAVLLIVVFASYGLYAKHLSFYWDDWSFAWVRFFQGLRGLKTMADITRPIRAYFEAALTPVLGINPLAWQIYAMLLRWIASLALWWFLRQVWEKHSRPIFMVALFYVVYPGFSQQSLAMTYHYFWFFQAIFYISLGLMVWAVRTPRRFWLGMIGALVLAVIQLFSSEYLVGLELLRPIFLWLALASVVPQFKPRLRRTAFYSVPFLLILGAYLFWRVFLLKFPTYQPTLLGQFQTAPLESMHRLVNSIWHSFGVVMVAAWENTLQVNIHQFDITRFALIYPLLVATSLVGLLLYQNRLQAQPSSDHISADHPRTYVGQFIGIGLAAILVAGIPFYVTGLNIQAYFDADRFSMSYLLGACLLLVGLVELLPNLWQSITLTALLAALAIGLQFYNSALFRNETDLQKTFAWQLVWRMPGLKQNTLMLSDDTTFPFTDDEGLTYLVNWTYAPENRTTHLPVAIDTISSRLGDGLPSLEKGQPIYQDHYLGADFRGSTDQVIVVSFNPPSCLRILNPAFDQDLIFLPVYKIRNGRIIELQAHALPPLAANALPLSNMDQIIPAPDRPAKPPAFLFNPEPSTTWCYFFEKADLARQTGDWQAVARLGDEAFSSQYFPRDLSEYLVFIEAYARLGRWQDAEKIAQSVSNPAPVINPALCAIWNRTGQARQLSDRDKSLLAGLKQEFQCDSVP
ncbi:MAG TPA: hypothetical protein VF355_01460 [Anaerolineaceae bacterium]